MKRILLTLAVITIFAGAIYAADSSSMAQFQNTAIPYQGVIGTYGKTPRTTQVTIDNTARGIDNLVVTGGGVYLGGSDNTLTPIAITASCDNTTRWSFQTTPSATVGHSVVGAASGGSLHFSGPDAVEYLKGVNAVEGTGASCAVTLWY